MQYLAQYQLVIPAGQRQERLALQQRRMDRARVFPSIYIYVTIIIEVRITTTISQNGNKWVKM